VRLGLRRERALTLAGAAIVLLALLAPLWAQLHKIGAPQEEGFMLVVPDRVLHGALPHADLAWLYGPASAWFPAAAYRLFGTDVLTARLVGLVYELVTVGVIFLLGLRWGRVSATAASLVAVLFVTTKGLTPLPWNGALPLVLLAVLFGVRALEHVEARAVARRAAFAAGLCAALATVFRADVAIGVVAALVVLGWRSPPWLRRDAIVGFAVGLVPWVVHVAMAGPGTVFRGLVTDPLHLQPSNEMPVPPNPRIVHGFIESFIYSANPKWPLPRLSFAAQLTAWFFLIVFALVATLAVALWARRRARTVRATLLLALGVLGVGLMPSVVQRADASHLNNLGALVFPALVFAGSEMVTVVHDDRRRTVLDALAATLVVVLVAGLTATWTSAAYLDDVLVSAGERDQKAASFSHRGRTFYFAPNNIPEVRDVVETVERVSKPGERLFVGPQDLRRTPYNDSMIYYLLPQLRPATRFIYMNPAVALHDHDELADDVASADVLVLSRQWDQWKEPNDSVKYGPGTANDVVRDEFCEVPLRSEHQTSLYRVYRRCRR
jgi:hypothetical protein